ncbi:MAG: ShlB/FhaC/HecB family hemolysin secretion/activation protein, partial [Alphaproteobacteria bacterium]|nr:ShlB/FhaC/HecB family hemolysin secretion/activation protein [Alphaproteobacteria bacterium]
LTITYAGTFIFEQLQFLQASYRQVLTSEGLTFFANASEGVGKPNIPFNPFLQNYNTRSQILESGFSYPVIRSRETNLTLTGLGFLTNDYAFANGDYFTRDRLRGFRLKGDADWADGFLGINQVNATFSQGINALGANGNLDPNEAHSNGGRVDFSKIEATISRTQPLPMNFSLFVAGYAQYAFTPLLVSEQCSFGGRFFGRAFDPSQMLADRCWEVLAEGRYDIATPWKELTKLQLYAFADHGELFMINPIPGGTPAVQSGTSAGGGVRLAWQDTYTADLSVAKAVDGPRNDWRAFVILAAKY